MLSFGTKHLAADHALEVKSWLELLLTQQMYCRNKRGYWYNQLAMVEMKYFKQFENVSAFGDVCQTVEVVLQFSKVYKMCTGFVKVERKNIKIVITIIINTIYSELK